MKFVYFLMFSMLFTAVSCGDSEEEKDAKMESKQELTEVKNGVFTEYYPGRKAIRIKGEQSDEGLREGRWSFFAENGKEMSYTYFKDGKKHGFSFNSYPNGTPYYYGEYWNDQMVGVWKTYDTEGNVKEKDYGYPKEY